MINKKLVITVSLLTGRFHGKGQGNRVEWPPSPFRLFQALVAGAAHTVSIDAARPALTWIEDQSIAAVLTPSAYKGEVVNLFVLTNQRDKAIGTVKTVASLRTQKMIEPMILSNADQTDIHYVFSDAAPENHLEVLQTIAKGVSHFGHGVDSAFVFANNFPQDQIELLDGEGWYRSSTQGTALSVPYPGSIENLEQRYDSWRKRATTAFKKISPPPPIPRHAFQKFSHEESPETLSYRTFEIRTADGQRTSMAHTSNVHIAGMIRHITTDENFAKLLGWTPTQMGMLHGHSEVRGESPKVATTRFGFVGLPSIRWFGAKVGWQIDDARRVIVTASKSDEQLLDEFALRLNHSILQPKDGAERMMLVATEKDPTIERYTKSAHRWVTVTPLVLPNQLGSSKDRRRLRDGRLDPKVRISIQQKLDRRIDSMIRKSIVNAGISQALAKAAVIRWSRRGWWPGAARAIEHPVNKHQKDRARRHVEISWFTPSGAPLELGGPIVLGAGAHMGLGLFAPHPETFDE